MPLGYVFTGSEKKYTQTHKKSLSYRKFGTKIKRCKNIVANFLADPSKYGIKKRREENLKLLRASKP